MKAINIKWDIDNDEILELLDNMDSEDAAENLGVPKRIYANMTTEERHNYALDYFRHCPGALDDFIGLPSEVEIPKELVDDEDISDWLSDKYGFCHYGFGLKEELDEI